eukprot:gene25036-biopygen11960
MPKGHRTLARAWRGHGAGVARAIEAAFGIGWRVRGAGMARAWPVTPGNRWWSPSTPPPPQRCGHSVREFTRPRFPQSLTVRPHASSLSAPGHALPSRATPSCQACIWRPKVIILLGCRGYFGQ